MSDQSDCNTHVDSLHISDKVSSSNNNNNNVNIDSTANILDHLPTYLPNYFGIKKIKKIVECTLHLFKNTFIAMRLCF